MAVLHYNFHSHTKIVGLPKATTGVYALALSYASGNLTDGFVPNNYARQLDAKRQHFGRLMDAGLMAKRPGGYQIHDYLDYNPSKAVVVEKRRLARERMNKIRANTPAKRPPRSREQQEDVTLNVRDIGQLQDQELEPGSPLTVVGDAALALLLEDESSTVVEDELAARRVLHEAEGGLRPIGGALAPVIAEMLRLAGSAGGTA